MILVSVTAHATLTTLPCFQLVKDQQTASVDEKHKTKSVGEESKTNVLITNTKQSVFIKNTIISKWSCGQSSSCFFDGALLFKLKWPYFILILQDVAIHNLYSIGNYEHYIKEILHFSCKLNLKFLLLNTIKSSNSWLFFIRRSSLTWKVLPSSIFMYLQTEIKIK